MFALVDANSFYCSAEAVFRPDWRNKPIIVLSNNDGCVVAVNRLAKAIGIERFKPFFQIKSLCEKHRVIVCSSNYELYADLSMHMMQIIGAFAPKQHVYSIDETFIDVSNSREALPPFDILGKQIRRAVWKEVRLPVCVGFGKTLTLCKVANHAAKRLPGFDGVCVIESNEQRDRILSKMCVSDVWGVGRKLSVRLKDMGITTALKLAKMPPKLAKQYFSVEMERTILELNGVSTKSWDEVRANKQQIFSTRSTGQRILELHSLMQAFSLHVSSACLKAREQGSVAGAILIFAHNSPFDDGISRGFKQVLRPACATNDSIVMSQLVSQAIPQLFIPGIKYYKVGVGLMDLTDEQHQQLDMFTAKPGRPELMKAVDALNKRYGSDTLFLGSQGICPKWHMRRDMLTPQYTTDWHHIPRICCK
ncbi:Y-family DNA polymerase [Agarivorans sp. 1_MG-2023]|uniref:Y-family DNA polymerase n=1 Tax=Agarivorans sp. 1_MG-2023 TaxID=3062634 RepID=UPI0026E2C844|nr:Y-family DNA polymerase [Agarivorans sp. 1_MG-2023]MDO6762970.1 Y-family DNA polymerase [Agarivorans sp. 1_MG-2023]